MPLNVGSRHWRGWGTFLGSALAGVLFAASPCGAVQEIQTDVCVYGGTSGGVIAAVQAARQGKRTALVVVNNHLGGMTSGGLGQTDIGGYGDAYIQGFAREFYTRIGQRYNTGAKFTFEPHVAEAVFNELVAQSGVQVFTNQQLASVAMNGARLVAATMDNGNTFRARIFIDASYEGDLMAKAGVSYTVGRESTNQYGESLNGTRSPNTGGHQFGSLTVDPFVTPGVPASGLLPLIQSGAPGVPGAADQRVQAYNFRMCLTQTLTNQLPITAPPGYSSTQYELLARYIQALVARGTTPTLGTFMNFGSMPNAKTDINNNGAVSTDFIGQSAAYAEADYATRAQIWRAHRNYLQGLFYFLATDLRVPSGVRSQMGAYGFCKDEFADNGGWPHQLYVREARRMISDYVMTQGNCQGKITATDSIGLAAYTMDSHNCQRVVVDGYAQNEGDVQSGTSGPYPVSYRSIVPRAAECTNLVVPWCLSASHMAFGSIRMEPVFMILSQAAGTAAAQAIDQGIALQDLSIYKLEAQLMADKQSLGTSLFNAEPGIIVDNTDSNRVSTVGIWTNSTSTTGFYGPDYLHDGNVNKGGSSVTYTPTLPEAGAYQVYVRWTAHSNRATNAPIDVIHPAGISTFVVNQTTQGGQWVLVLTTNFDAGMTGKVRIRNGGTSGYVVADAVEFIPANSLPVVNVWAADAEAARPGFDPATVIISRSGNTNGPLVVNLTFSGTAGNGADYTALPTTVNLPTGVSFTNLVVQPTSQPSPVGLKTMAVAIMANAGYAVGELNSASVRIHDTPYWDWSFHQFGASAGNPAVGAESAAPAGDGIPNFVKYAFGLDPLTPHNGSPVTLVPRVNTNGFFTVAYTRPDPAPADVAYLVESSSDLVSWCGSTNCVLLDQIQYAPNGTATLNYRLPVPTESLGQSYLRLRVSER